MRHLKFSLISLLLIFSQFDGFGQWSIVDFNIPSSLNTQELDADIIGYDTLKVSFNHSLNNPYRIINNTMISTDNGASWSTFSDDKWCYFENYNSVYGLKGDSLFYSSNAGATWQYKSSITSFESFEVIDYQTIAYYTYQGEIKVSTNFGATWSTVSTPSYLTSFWFDRTVKLLSYLEGYLKMCNGKSRFCGARFLVGND